MNYTSKCYKVRNISISISLSIVFSAVLFEVEDPTRQLDHFEALYSDPVIKWISIVVYLVGFASFAVLAALIWFERTGMAGGYRTLNNQLTSMMVEQVKDLSS